MGELNLKLLKWFQIEFQASRIVRIFFIESIYTTRGPPWSDYDFYIFYYRSLRVLNTKITAYEEIYFLHYNIILE